MGEREGGQSNLNGESAMCYQRSGLVVAIVLSVLVVLPSPSYAGGPDDTNVMPFWKDRILGLSEEMTPRQVREHPETSNCKVDLRRDQSRHVRCDMVVSPEDKFEADLFVAFRSYEKNEIKALMLRVNKPSHRLYLRLKNTIKQEKGIHYERKKFYEHGLSMWWEQDDHRVILTKFQTENDEYVPVVVYQFKK